MSDYLFVLGTNSTLSYAEIRAVLHQKYPDTSLYQPHPRVALVSLTESEPHILDQLMKRLGGTIKIAEVVQQFFKLQPDTLTDLLKERIDPTLPFGVSLYTAQSLSLVELMSEVKRGFKMRFGLSVRYILPKDSTEISAVLLDKQKVQEFILVKNKSTNDWYIGKTQVYQHVDEWTKRDFGKPFRDARSGMLPPKIARIMLNLGLQSSKIEENRLILDPFCGTGTLLAEALILGCDVIGSDISPLAVQKTTKNLEWLQMQYPSIKSGQIKQILASDATHISEQVSKFHPHAIVTEPFMGAVFSKKGTQIFLKGKPVTHKTIANVIKGLEKLYIGAFKDWQKILSPGAKVVISLPEIHYEGRIYFVKNAVDSCEKLGYTLDLEPIPYFRPDATIRRQIFVFSKQ